MPINLIYLDKFPIDFSLTQLCSRYLEPTIIKLMDSFSIMAVEISLFFNSTLDNNTIILFRNKEQCIMIEIFDLVQILEDTNLFSFDHWVTLGQSYYHRPIYLT